VNMFLAVLSELF